MNPSRYPWIDHLKALGIFLVVAGHTALPVAVHSWIYAFHMPLFFMASGFLISPGGFSVPAAVFFKRRIWKLVWLYFLFGLLGAAVYCYFFKDQHTLPEMLRGRISALLYGSASRNRPEDLYPLVLWFFPALIVGMSLVFGAWRIPTAWGKCIAVGIIFAVGGLLGGRALPWEFESGCLAAGFIAAGHAARIRGVDGLLRQPSGRMLIFGTCAIAAGSYLAVLNVDCLDVRTAGFGNPFLSIPAMLLLIAGFTALAMPLPASVATSAIAVATILIFPVHTMIFPYFDRVAEKSGVMRAGLAADAPWYGWTKATLVVAGLSLAHFLYGQLKARRALAARPAVALPPDQ